MHVEKENHQEKKKGRISRKKSITVMNKKEKKL